MTQGTGSSREEGITDSEHFSPYRTDGKLVSRFSSSSSSSSSLSPGVWGCLSRELGKEKEDRRDEGEGEGEGWNW